MRLNEDLIDPSFTTTSDLRNEYYYLFKIASINPAFKTEEQGELSSWADRYFLGYSSSRSNSRTSRTSSSSIWPQPEATNINSDSSKKEVKFACFDLPKNGTSKYSIIKENSAPSNHFELKFSTIFSLKSFR